MKKALLAVAQAIAAVQRRVIELLRMIPGSEHAEEFAEVVTRPIRNLAGFFLRKFPVLKRWEWLLEIDRLRRINPVMLLVLLAFVFYRGMKTTYLGHIATDMVIYPFLGAISYFNPFLGIISAVVFGIGDVLQKLVYNDIFGSAGVGRLAFLGAYGDLNYWGGVGGYCIAYSSIAMAGLFPGMLARVFRLGARKTLAFFFFRRTAAAADGARPGETGKGGAGSGGAKSGGTGSLMPGGVEPTYPAAELFASVVGAALGTSGIMYAAAPTLEAPAFYMRPDPDVSCHNMEVATYLRRPAFRSGIGGPATVGPLMSGFVPVSPGGGDKSSLFGEEPETEWEPTPDPEPLRDPETGEELTVQDGSYEGGKTGQVWYKGKWMDAAEAAFLINRWEQRYEQEKKEWYERETEKWREDVARKKRGEGYDRDPYRDEWRKLPEAVEPVEIPEEEEGVLKPQWSKKNASWFKRFFAGGDADYVKLEKRLNQLDGLEKDVLKRYRDLAAKQKTAEGSGDKWLAEQYKLRRVDERQSFRRLRDAKFDLTGRFTDESKGGRVYEKKQRDFQKKYRDITLSKVGQAGREVFWDPIKHVFKPNLADKDGNGPLGTAFKRLEKTSNWMRLRARQMPRLDDEFQDSMNALKMYRDQMVDAERREDAVTIRALETRMKAERHRALEINRLRGDLAGRTQDWARSAGRVTMKYYETMADRAGAAQMQYQIGRIGSRIGAKVTGAFDADAPVVRSVKGEAKKWEELHKQNPKEFHEARQRIRSQGGSGGGGGRGGGGGGGGEPPNLTKYDLELDRQFRWKQEVAGRKVARWNDNQVRLQQAKARVLKARDAGDMAKIREAVQGYQDAERRLARSVNRGLSDPYVKAQMKRAPSDVQYQWNVDAKKFRTNPVRQKTVDIINHDKPWVVQEGPGKFRRLRDDDLSPVSSHEAAGMDLDLNPNQNIVHMKTGQRISDAQIQSVVDQACKKMRISSARQDIHVMSSRSPGAYRVPAGMDPNEALQPGVVRDASPMDGEHMKQVGEWKMTQEAANDLAGRCYTTSKDYRRFTQPMLDRHPGARRPPVFTDDAMQILDDVGARRISPGTGNARFKQITGMDLDEGCRKINSMQQSVPTLDSPARRIEIARSRGARTLPVDMPDTPVSRSIPGLKEKVGELGPTLKTEKARKLHDYLQRKDPGSFITKDGKVKGWGRDPAPEVTNTGDAARARAMARGIKDPASEQGKAFGERLHQAMDADPAFKATHQKVEGALMKGGSAGIDAVSNDINRQLVTEGNWGNPGSPSFNEEFNRRLKLAPRDGVKMSRARERALFEGGISEQEFDTYIDVRQKLWRGEKVDPIQPPGPQDPARSPVYVDVSQRKGSLGADPAVPLGPEPPPAPPGAPPAAPSGGHPGQAPPAPPRPGATHPPPGASAPETPPVPPESGRPDLTRPDPVRPDYARPEYTRPEAARPEHVRPEYEQPEYARPDAARPEYERPEYERPEAEIPEHEWPDHLRPEYTRPDASRLSFAQRFMDFFKDDRSGG